VTTIAWFSPLPPVRSGIADANASCCRLERELAIDRYDEPRAHDFIWRNQRAPYDLVVYQLGNASCHDFVWAYLARFPGLVVVHDPTLHHARARQLLGQRRFDDYRREFWFDHPAANRDFVEYAVEGLGGPIYYFWSMLAAVMKTARMIAVHNERVARIFAGVSTDADRGDPSRDGSTRGERRHAGLDARGARLPRSRHCVRRVRQDHE